MYKKLQVAVSLYRFVGNNLMNVNSNKSLKLPILKCILSHHVGRGKNERITRCKNWNIWCVHKIPVEETTIKICLQADHVAEDDLESSVLLTWHMQSGHGKEYMESFGLLISNPLESL
jgi:hypothetical protein